MPRRKSSTCFVVAAGLFLVFGSIPLLADLSLGYGVIKELQATRWPTTQGVVASSKVDVDNSGDSPSFANKIQYGYTLNGKDYVGHRLRFVEVTNERRVNRIANENPEGRKVTVYYSPNDPAESVLSTGVEAIDLCMLMLLVPFNWVLVGPVVALAILRQSRASPTGGAAVFDDGEQTVVRLPGVSAWMVGAAVASVVCLPVAIGLLLACSDGPVWTALAGWALVIVVGAYAAWRQSKQLAEGGRDIRIDDVARTISLPPTEGRRERLTIPVKQIRSIQVKEQQDRDSEGDTKTYQTPTIYWREGNSHERSQALCKWQDADCAARLVEWLQARLGVFPAC